MTGIDKILNEISSRGRDNADAVIAAATAKAEKIRSDGAAKAQQTYDSLIEKYRLETEREYMNSCASIEAKAKRSMLSCRVECVDRAVEAVREKLASLDEKTYFKLLTGLFSKHIHSGKCTVSFGSRDLARMPEGFVGELSQIAEKSGAKLTVSDKAAPVSSGFILCFGDISENCSFDAILEAERDNVRDTAAAVLFA